MADLQDIAPPPRAEQLKRAVADYRSAGGDRLMAHLIVDCVFDASPAPVSEESR